MKSAVVTLPVFVGTSLLWLESDGKRNNPTVSIKWPSIGEKYLLAGAEGSHGGGPPSLHSVKLLLSLPCFSSRRRLTPPFTTQRVGSLNTRCSINTDVLIDIATDQEVWDDVATDDCGCSVPVLHLKSDILETEALNLLAKGTFVDILLTTLPVLSEEEQNIIAANPAHPAGLYACCNWWRSSAAQLVSVGMIIHGHTLHPTSASSLLFRPWFIVLVLAGAVERLSGLALGVAVERDWVVLLAGTNRPVALAQANAVLSCIDHLCEIVGEPLFGILLSKYEPVVCLKIAADLITLLLGISDMANHKLSSGVLDRAVETCFSCSSPSSLKSENIVGVGLEAIKHGWFEYVRQPVLPASIAYVLLYFNVVLAWWFNDSILNAARFKSVYYWGL
ncbi:hypothetical protein K7X08_036463 [Anisodus acutangulus]|uniref:Solute carrier family 40 member n=1 Tax=Anisodus acutangulus TaxID=402998 RepID=A0A9Q1L5B7_9SOLA|nr:hypothetical protein K7X08_036463 [Anisodus acutangulus]